MADRKWWSLETLLVVGVVFVAIVVLVRMAFARSRPVIQEAQRNPWVALIDASPGLLKTVGGFVGGIFGKHDENPSGIDADTVKWIDTDVAPFVGGA